MECGSISFADALIFTIELSVVSTLRLCYTFAVLVLLSVRAFARVLALDTTLGPCRAGRRIADTFVALDAELCA
jgi:hypothetical protein